MLALQGKVTKARVYPKAVKPHDAPNPRDEFRVVKTDFTLLYLLLRPLRFAPFPPPIALDEGAVGCAGGCVGDERVEMIIPVRGFTCGKVCADSSGCLATQAAVMVQPGCWNSLLGGDVGWLRNQQQGLGSNALAERCSNGGRVGNARAVMVPVRPRETPSLGDSGNGASMRALEVVSTAYGTSGDTGIQCSLRQLLEHGYFHADPHPDNLLATPDGRLAFLDFGMMSETPASARFAIIGHVVHLVNRDYDAIARDYYELNFLSGDVDVSPIVPALQSFFDDVLTATVSELNIKTIVDGLGSVLYQYPFNGKRSSHSDSCSYCWQDLS
jgi:hypothetical protein